MTDTEPGLVLAAQRGDREAFAQLYEENVTRVFRYLRARLSEPSDAEDITAGVFIKAMQALPAYKQRGAPFGAWLLRIAHNELATFYKKRARRNETTLEEAVIASEDPTQVALEQIAFSEVQAAMGGLTELQQQVIGLRFGSGLSIIETAQAMDRKEGAVKFLQHSAIEALRRELEARGQYGE
ncbi:MAG: sigma-70 family RNA polymerase sigma factor [Dehalococcoidia bacterium]